MDCQGIWFQETIEEPGCSTYFHQITKDKFSDVFASKNNRSVKKFETYQIFPVYFAIAVTFWFKCQMKNKPTFFNIKLKSVYCHCVLDIQVFLKLSKNMPLPKISRLNQCIGKKQHICKCLENDTMFTNSVFWSSVDVRC